MSEIRMSEMGMSKIKTEILTAVCSFFRHIRCLKSEQVLDFRQILKKYMSENRTVWKPNIY